ncbi:hypothetical protein BCEN4_140098 [Burkholderia cenocepacia]|nr:hypothetical protein BCEN4_140098 [Burkholderia cenocepacia]
MARAARRSVASFTYALFCTLVMRSRHVC